MSSEFSGGLKMVIKNCARRPYSSERILVASTFLVSPIEIFRLRTGVAIRSFLPSTFFLIFKTSATELGNNIVRGRIELVEIE